jgi:SNF2 family DNA or RNA helicase
MLKREQLHAYQKRAIEQAKITPHFGAFFEVGLGKTIRILTIIAEYYKGKTLVVCPKKVAETVWHKEAANWEHTKHLRVVKIVGSEKQRIAALQQEADVYVINLENFVWLTGRPEMLVFTNLCLDESQKWKATNTKRFKALKKFLKQFEHRLIATATPAPQGLQDLYSQVGILDLGQRLGTSLTRFREAYMEPDQINRHTRQVYSWKLRQGMDDVINKKIEDICFALKAEDYLQLPPITVIIHSIELSNNARRQYDKMRKNMVLEVEGQTITAPTAAALAGKLQQFASGATYTQDGEWIETHSDKMEYLVEILESNVSPTLIFYNYKHSLERLKTQFPQGVVLDATNIEAWTTGKIPMLFAHPKSAGAGLNLQNNTGHVAQIVWWDGTWSSEEFTQGNGRIQRQGQTSPVIIHQLTMSGTIDEVIVDALDKKVEVQNILLDALKMP